MDDCVFDEAVSAAQRALTVNDKDIRFWFVLALAQFRLGDYEAVIETSNAGLAREKDFVSLLKLRMQAEFNLGIHTYPRGLSSFNNSACLRDF